MEPRRVTAHRRTRARRPFPSRLPAFLFPLLLLVPSRALAAGAVDTVAQEAAQGLGPTPAASLVVAAPLVSDEAAPHGDELALRVAALVAGRLGASSHAHAKVAPLATARALAGRASALVFVQTEIARGDLRTTIDVYPSMANAWDRIRNPLPAPIGHAFATTKIDAEVRAFLAPLVLEQASVHRVRQDEGEVLAVGCGDVDGDGGDELVLVSRARVAVGRVRGGAFVAERTAPWEALAPRLPVPMRDPLGAAVVAPGAIDVGTTDRGGVALTPDFVTHAPLAGMPVWGGGAPVCLMPEPSAGAYDGAPFDCTLARDRKPKMAVPAPRFDAFAAWSSADAQGRAEDMIAVREPSGRLDLRSGDAPPRVLDGPYGAQLAVADLDQDGAPEIATTADGPEDAIDVVTVASPSEDPRPRLHLPAPAGVRALAVCPPEENGEPVLVAVVGDELWLVRAGEEP